MDEKQLREVFLERLHIEIQLFKDSMLRKSKADIYAAGYRIELYACLYEILTEQAESMPEMLMRAMVYHPCSILDVFYEEWLKRADGFYTEIGDYVEDELKAILASAAACGRMDNEDGRAKAA